MEGAKTVRCYNVDNIIEDEMQRSCSDKPILVTNM
jgi:hypothetical protein